MLYVARLFKNCRSAGDPLHMRQARENICYTVKRAGQEFIVRIDPAHYIAGRSLKTCIYGAVMAAIRTAAPVAQMFFVFLDDGYRVVCAASVHNDVFQVWITLVQHRFNTLFQINPLIEGGSDDRDFGQAWPHEGPQDAAKLTGRGDMKGRNNMAPD